MTSLHIPTPEAFDFDRVVRSHGWYALPPTAYADGVLTRTLLLPDAHARTVRVTYMGTNMAVRVDGEKLNPVDRAAVRRDLMHMLALDADLSELHAACAGVPHLTWVPATGAGRLFRSPTVWEDLVKTLCTTNCSWAATRGMVGRLVETLGEPAPDGAHAFPTAGAVARSGVPHLKDVVRMGYRAPALIELAESIESGTLDTDHWFDPAVPDEQVHAELLALRGFGPYAAEGMLGLLGRPRGLALDSWIRANLPRLIGRRSMTDKQIAARYRKLGRWAGTGLWLEVTQRWFDLQEGEPLTLRG